ncbi:hypothetical protein BKA57DRAFT_438112 [Linnemannia elongata]|nr:hypothetical protein BKA57DRAFT_438112 [Linnemannia elongata]
MADKVPDPTYVVLPPPDWPTPPVIITTTTTTTTTNPSEPTNTTSGQIIPTDSPKTTTDGEIVNPPPTSTSNDINPTARTTTTTAGGSGGGVTLPPGIATSFRGDVSSTQPSSLPGGSGDSYTLVSSSVSGVVLALAFIGVLVMGLVAGVVVMKYTRFGRRKDQEKVQGELIEQLRNLTDTIGQRNDLLDREEKNIQAAANQADFLPAWYRNQSSLHPQSVPDQTYYQDWATPFGSSGSPLVSSTLRQPRVINLPPTQLPPDVGGPKGEWSNANADVVTASSSSQGSASDLNEFERRRPQIQEEGQGGDSLFDIGNQSHNPHAINSNSIVVN